ncbi:MAG: ankyrin repeat domain-containing protein [Thermodesulfobacteriota bacterium]
MTLISEKNSGLSPVKNNKKNSLSQSSKKLRTINSKEAKTEKSNDYYGSKQLTQKKDYHIINQGHLDQIDHSKLPEEKLRKLIRKGRAADIINFYEKHNTDINISLTKKKAMPVFHYLVLMNPEAAKDLFKTGMVDIKKSPHVFTASVAKGDKETIDYLLDIGFSPDQDDEKVRPAYISSVIHGHPEISELLENKGADIQKTFKGKNALDWAVSSKFTSTDLLGKLLNKGFEYKKNHIIDAAKYGRRETLEHILKKNPDFKDTYKNGENLMDIAVKGSGGKELLNLLLKRGFDINKTHLKASEKRLEQAFIYSKNGKKHIVNSDKNAQKVHNFIVKYLYERSE